MLSVTHAASCRQLSSGVSLAADRTVVDFLGGQSVPWGLAASRIILQSSLLPPPQPPVVCALGDSKLTEDLAVLGRPEDEATLASTSVFPYGAHPSGTGVVLGHRDGEFLRRYPSRNNSATNYFSSTFSLLSWCTSCCVASRTASRVNRSFPASMNSLIHA